MTAQENLERALVALFAQVPETVARDVGAKVHAAVAEYDADVERLLHSEAQALLTVARWDAEVEAKDARIAELEALLQSGADALRALGDEACARVLKGGA